MKLFPSHLKSIVKLLNNELMVSLSTIRCSVICIVSNFIILQEIKHIANKDIEKQRSQYGASRYSIQNFFRSALGVTFHSLFTI